MKCLVTMLRQDTAWSNITCGWNKRWADAHEYRFLKFYSNSLWAKPAFVLDAFNDGCDFVFFLDADAVVAKGSPDRFFSAASKPALTFTEYHTNRSVHFKTSGHFNTGVFFASKGEQATKMLTWWSQRGNGTCKTYGWLDEQSCAESIHRLHPQDTQVVRDHTWNRGINIYLAFTNQQPLMVCMSSGALICHATGTHFYCKKHRRPGERLVAEVSIACMDRQRLAVFMPLRAALASTAHARQAHAATAHAAYADTATATAAAMLAPPLPSATLEPTHLLREGMATRWRPQQSQDGGLLGSRVWRDDAAMRSVTSFVAGSRIPRLIHQLWKTPVVPSMFAQYQQTWRTRHPAWVLRLWTDDDVRVLLHDIVPFLSPVLRKAAWISSVDLARYVILHRYGGLYVDMDIETFRSFEPLCENASLLLTYKPADPSIMASEPNHPFWMWMFERVQRCTKPSDVYRLTGPPGLQEAVEQYLRGATPGAPTIQRFNYGLYQLDRSRRVVSKLRSTPCHYRLCLPDFERGGPSRLQGMWGYHHCTQSWNTGHGLAKGWNWTRPQHQQQQIRPPRARSNQLLSE